LQASANLWIECTRLAVEGAELTPALLSDRSTAPEVTVVSSPSGGADSVHVSAFVEARLGGGIVILVANTATQPVQVTLTLTPGVVKDGVATVLFANRNVTVAGGVLHDWVDAMGTRAYRLTPVGAGRTARAEPNPKNLLFNPSFERMDGGGGLPDGFWSTVQNDSAASAFSDPRDSVHGLHSLRIHTPTDGGGLLMEHFMCPVTLEPSTAYALSVWARGVAFGDATLSFSFGLGGQMKTVSLTEEWQLYDASLQTPSGPSGGCYTESTFKVMWTLQTPGVAFLDLMELVSADSQPPPPPLPTPELAEPRAQQPAERYAQPTNSDVSKPLLDSLGLPLSPIGFFSHELGSPDLTVPVSTHRKGMTSGFLYLPHGDTDIAAVSAWLDRCDAVGTTVLLDVRFDATTATPPLDPAKIAAAIEGIQSKVAALMHHPSIFAWYRIRSIRCHALQHLA
jgi:hypothetical protein